MSADIKKFLVPVATTIAALSSTEAHATVQTEPSHEADAIKSTPKNIALSDKDQRATFQMGAELHSLILRHDNQGIIYADHESHASHSSHSSHMSGS